MKTTVVLLAIIFAVTSVLASGLPALLLDSGDEVGFGVLTPELWR
ncbi:hypothetical protein [Glutamicibacter uratoxydans]